MQNPLKALRLVSGETQESLGQQTNVSKQYISRLEKGMYPKLNSRYRDYLLKVAQSEITPNELERLYNEWKNWKRRDTIAVVGPLSLAKLMEVDYGPVASGSKHHSQPQYIKFQHWRDTYWDSIYEFCEDFCLRTYDVERYESGAMQGMPVAIQRVLEPFGLLEGFKVHKR